VSRCDVGRDSAAYRAVSPRANRWNTLRYSAYALSEFAERVVFYARLLTVGPGSPTYVNVINIHNLDNGEGIMPIVAKLDELGRPAWILLMILGFMVWWPVGLMVLAFIIGSGRMGCGYHGDRWQRKMERLQDKMDRMRGHMQGHMEGRGDWWGYQRSSGNRAFDEYRTETLRRLEDEQREFRDFLERLRQAKDKAEFDQFMAERRNRPPEQASPQA
jgi:hypothetical protein